ncbi:MAG: hypothetical protein ACI4QE_03660 [Acutalibacteraceae bacterium]
MKSRLIFYLSQKTSYCELSLKKSLLDSNIEIDSISAATSPMGLGEKLIVGFSSVNLIFIIGGISREEIRSLQNVLSKALSNSCKEVVVKKLSNPKGEHHGYIIRCNRQTIISLPDEPDEIESILKGDIMAFLKDFYLAESE